MLVFDAFKSRNSSPTEHYSRIIKDRINSLAHPVLMPDLNRRKFPADKLRPAMRNVLATSLTNVRWDSNDRAAMSAISKDICERVKQVMLDINPGGFKYIVTSSCTENLGQAGRADMSSHWEDTDVAVQEMYSNETMIFVCIAYAVRVV